MNVPKNNTNGPGWRIRCTGRGRLFRSFPYSGSLLLFDAQVEALAVHQRHQRVHAYRQARR